MHDDTKEQQFIVGIDNKKIHIKKSFSPKNALTKMKTFIVLRVKAHMLFCVTLFLSI